MYKQNAIHYPAAASSDHSDIIDAAKSRAKFWGYNLEGNWNVTITVDKKICEVAHVEGRGYCCAPRGGTPFNLAPTR